VLFRRGGREVDGWALNASRSGLRAILEASVPLGEEFEIEVGEAAPRPGRVVWLQEEKDGAIVGVNFLDEAGRSGSIPDIQALSVVRQAAPGRTPHAPPVAITPATGQPPAARKADDDGQGGQEGSGPAGS
jgi:hypothetical protein